MNNALAGAIAGAAGTAALNCTTYCDMALTGRSSSETPAEVIRRLAKRADLEPLAQPNVVANESTKNRRTALGALSGYGIGVSMGTVYGLLSPLFSGAPLLTKGLALAAASMIGSEAPAAAVGATDPRQWGIAGWIRDIVPRAVYGLVTAAVVDALAENGRANESPLTDANDVMVGEIINEEIVV